ncbi:MAG: sugar transferase [Richelia sp.]|nr:sugar transferase [Richelia sp.]
MGSDAEQLKSLVNNEVNGLLLQKKDDFRITRVGQFLTKTSLDEFPQFWNILLGEMSLVGTRPPTSD